MSSSLLFAVNFLLISFHIKHLYKVQYWEFYLTSVFRTPLLRNPKPLDSVKNDAEKEIGKTVMKENDEIYINFTNT